MHLVSKEIAMKVSKWVAALPFACPANVVEAVKLIEGDEIEVRIAGLREIEISRDRSWELAIERLRQLRRPFPSGLIFDRAASNER
jgi:antitoxin MazE